ncbi:uncharacterized protein [Halyomorpha halys]|uniref:uncharacterized protein n=1 Tax=Halyomorpha halys TaxID=286706 RepID=UPI0006D4F4ED|nr:uncharacterized protein LOC112209991 [Halyomorpha halys]
MQVATRNILTGVERSVCNGLLRTSTKRPTAILNTLPRIRGMAKKKDDCAEEEIQERAGMSCKRPDLRKKPIPPYKYGYCREPDVPMMMSCPPKGQKGAKGPCCHEEEPNKGGCKRSK